MSKRMIYHYFGGKDLLFREVVRTLFAPLAEAALSGTDEGLARSFVRWQELLASQPQLIRLSLWQSLRARRDAPLPDDMRAFWQGGVSEIRRAQSAGRIHPSLDAAQLQLSLVALVMFPFVLPQLTRMITGLHPDDPEFLRLRAESFATLGSLLAPDPERP